MKNSKVLYKLLLALFWTLVIAFFAVYCYALVKYSNVPISEMPVWVAWLLFSPRG